MLSVLAAMLLVTHFGSMAHISYSNCFMHKHNSPSNMSIILIIASIDMEVHKISKELHI